MPEQNPQNNYFTKRVGRNVFETRPRISVIIAVNDSVDLVRETLESVISQKYREHEIIVVNDGSTETDRLERELKTNFENIIYIKQRRAGISAARNIAIENARGDLIAFVDNGHLWQPDFLTTQLVFIERHNYAAVYCDAVLFGMHSAYRRTFMESSPSEGEVNFESLINGRCNVLTAGAMVRRQALLDVGMFQESAEAFADFALWLRLAQRSGGIGYQQKQLLKYRAHADYRLADDLTRLETQRDVLESFRQTTDLTEDEAEIIAARLEELEAAFAVEQGNVFLSTGNYHDAAIAFRVANGHQKSLKLTAIAWLARLAPWALLKFYRGS